jgi:hypothetical protein
MGRRALGVDILHPYFVYHWYIYVISRPGVRASGVTILSADFRALVLTFRTPILSTIGRYM